MEFRLNIKYDNDAFVDLLGGSHASQSAGPRFAPWCAPRANLVPSCSRLSRRGNAHELHAGPWVHELGV